MRFLCTCQNEPDELLIEVHAHDDRLAERAANLDEARP
jgi:hypothetical protein